MRKFDKSFYSDTVKLIAGTDEAGRGPLAGPVVAAAVVFPPDTYIRGVRDSKQLTKEEREKFYPKIISKCLSYSVCAVSHGTIDKINILQASLLAMTNCIDRLLVKPDLILIDGNKCFPYSIPTRAIIHGDDKSFAIAAASIIAKVTRDRIMERLSVRYPMYLWDRNKGYATRKHIAAIKEHGSCCLHRQTFLRKILSGEFEPEFEFEMEMVEPEE